MMYEFILLLLLQKKKESKKFSIIYFIYVSNIKIKIKLFKINANLLNMSRKTRRT